MSQLLVLSIFPGIGLLDRAFEKEGFTVVRGPDRLWGGDIATFHAPAGVFDGIVGGDPCQSHSTLARLVRAKGYEPRYPDMTADYARIVEEAQPRWFLRENVPLAPDLAPAGYGVSKLKLRNLWIAGDDGLGQHADRKRCFWFGLRGQEARSLAPFIGDAMACLEQPRRLVALTAGTGFPPIMKLQPEGAVISGHADQSFLGRSAQRAKDGYRVRAMAEPAVTNRHPGAFPTTDQPPTGWAIEAHQAVLSDSRAVPVAIGGSGKRKVTAAHMTQVSHGAVANATTAATGGNGRMPISEMCRLQGLPENFLEDAPFTADGKRQVIANGVPLPMGRAIARAVRRGMGYDHAEESAG